MYFNASAAVGNEGLYAVGLTVFRELRWPFRPHEQCDVGIDAHVEDVVGEIATGRLIGLQIKSGASFFREERDGGYVFRSDLRHLNYYMRMSIPVLVALYDPCSGTALWERVDETTVRRTPKGWSLLVPKTQIVGKAAEPAWRRIAAKRDLLAELPPVIWTSEAVFPLFEALHAAERSIDFTTFHLSPAFAAILDFVSVRRRVRGLVGNPDALNGLKSSVGEASRLELRHPRSDRGAFHEKMLILDDAAVCSGSANMTLGARSNYEVMDVFVGGERTEMARRRFQEAWAAAIPIDAP